MTKIANLISRFLILGGCLTSLVSCTTSSTTGTKSDPGSSATIHTQLAAGYLDVGNLSVAQEELDIALGFDASHSDANYVYALLMLQLGKTDDAEQYFRRALRTNPDNGSAAHDFGVYLCRTGEQEESIEYFEMAAENPLFDRKELSLMRAGECMVGRDPKSAEQFLRAALEINPRLQAALIQMATISFDEREYLQARAYIERFLGVSGGTAEGLYLAYQIESSLGADTVAGEYRETLVKEYGESEEAALLRRSPREGQ
jgi:type IV pilus assembly protein PilF